jgi:putative hydrolase of the HAD superfamily
MIRAVGFDLDDTLYDHAQYVEGAYRDVAAAAEAWAGVPGDEFYERILTGWRRLSSRSPRIFADTLAAYGAFTPELETRLVEVYRAHKPILTPHAGVLPGLQALRESGLRLGLLTDGQPAVQRRKRDAILPVAAFYIEVYTGDLGRAFYKRHESGFRHLLDGLGLPAGAVAYVGDNPATDFEAAKRLGMTTLRIQLGEYRRVPGNPGWIDRTFEDTIQTINWILAGAERVCDGAT